MSSPQLELVLWVSQTIIQAAIATVIYRRKLHKQFPAFFAYIVAQILIFCVQLPIYHSGREQLYLHVYWVCAAVNVILAFKIIHEIFLDIFKPYHALKDLGTALFKWAAIIMVLVSAVMISLSPSWEGSVINSIVLVQRCVQVVQCGLVIFLLAFCSNLGIDWRRLNFGIALGFGLTSASDLLSTSLYFGRRVHLPTMQLIIMLTYVAGMLVWLLYSLSNRRRDMVPVLVPQRWDEALMEIQPPQGDADSLIPMFEHMVDQALSKSHDTHA